MKKIILSIASLCMTGIAFGQQWTTSGNNIYNSNTGNVGIGLTAPAEKLGIDGNVELNSQVFFGISRYLKIDRVVMQRTSVADNGWNRGHVGQGIIWDDVNKKWQIGLGVEATNSDFAMMRYENGGGISFYTANGTGATYQLTDAALQASYKRMVITNTGNVGIGDASPSEKLSVQGNVKINGNIGFAPASGIRNVSASSTNGGLALYGGDQAANGGAVIIYNNGPSEGRVDVVAGDGDANANNNNGVFNVMKYASGAYQGLMNVYRDGKISMGNITSRPGTYKLYVEQGILTEKVRVAVQGTANWSDHVFADNYNLKPLTEVEGYIKENKHLPEIPSAKDVVKDGVDLGAMDAKLLQKIEELTLYVIQQQKEIEQLKKQIK